MNGSRWIAGMALLAACTLRSETSERPLVAAAAESAGADLPQVLPEVHRRGEDKLVVAVGPAGGTLELDNGARLLIPRGTLAENTEVTLATGTRTTAFANHDYERTIGPTLEVVLESSVHGPVELSIPLSALPEGFEDSELTLGVEVPATSQRYQSAATQTRWDYIGASSHAGRAVAQLEPPGYRVQFLVSKND